MNLPINHLQKELNKYHFQIKMAAVLVSAKVSVFLQQVQQDFPQVFPTVLLGTALIKHKKHNKNRG